MTFFLVNTCSLIKGLSERGLYLVCNLINRMTDDEIRSIA